MNRKLSRRLILSLLMCCFSLRSAWVWAQQEVTDVLIVGAGLSGLSAAYHLKKAGKSSVILEMSPHIGGRIRTAAYANNAHAEVGLEEFWENNPAIEILRELNIPLETSYTSFSSFYYQGKLHPFSHDSNLEFLESFIDSDEMRAYKAWDSKMAALYRQLGQQPLPAEIMALKDISFADWIKNTSALSPKTQEFVRIETEPEYAASWHKISALDGIAEWHLFSGEGLAPRHVVGGNQRATEAIADFVGRDNIRLNQLVTHIKSDHSSVEVTVTDQASFQQQVFRARYVIAAIPLFRLNDIQFTPPLTPDRRQAIQSQSAGAYFTAHVLVDGKADKFWKQDDESILPILTDGPLGVIYEGHSEVGHDAILNLLVSGAEAERFNARIASSDDIRESLLEAFERLWPGFGPLVKQMTFYRYHPRAIASWPVGRSRFDQLSEAFRQPQGRVYFAGDFTEDTHSNGAANSAMRVVKGIMQGSENTE
ncbi:FAD-dependent oxidoreductase [Methylomonas sp. LL1]|uniref:flavin monoamine oxidase family protein n=1 Tax=Methylomonas sp. LL1 TaxID=2785785 RepID=UPI0018C3A11B|nr:NAD(P)/FAD-dependent oxidoreductase [Methylomonas sp. LL1]QPK61958.1 FAD-dependent oxidoreductase [Methylomonas sp. LL1]CAG1021581.1 monoamine oxidase [Methylococcales bacterium]